MWKLIGGTLAVLAVIILLTKMQNGHPGLDPRDQLTFEKQIAARRQEVRAAKTAIAPALDCAARQVSDLTVQTLFLVWINGRSDLASVTDRDDATRDLTQKITGCGGDTAKLEDAAHENGMELEAFTTIAMLKAGR